MSKKHPAEKPIKTNEDWSEQERIAQENQEVADKDGHRSAHEHDFNERGLCYCGAADETN